MEPLFTQCYQIDNKSRKVIASAISPDGTMIALSYSTGQISIISEHF